MNSVFAQYEELPSPQFAVINLSLRLRLITANFGLDNSSYRAQPHSIIVKYSLSSCYKNNNCHKKETLNYRDSEESQRLRNYSDTLIFFSTNTVVALSPAVEWRSLAVNGKHIDFFLNSPLHIFRLYIASYMIGNTCIKCHKK